MERFRFGIFTFTPSTGELRRGDVRVPLQGQPAKVLTALLAKPGEIVARDALKREIWGDGTHVDFERGLNFCIAQVRSALGDSAESPRYVETIPRQGYRFIAPVTVPASDLGAVGLATAVDGSAPPDAALAPEAAAPATPRRAHLWTFALLGLVVAAIVATIGWARMRPAPATVIVVPFYNETGRPELDPVARALGDAVVASLAAPPRIDDLSVIGNAPSLRNPFARQDVQRTAQDLGAQWVLIGQLKADAAGLRLIAHLIRATDMKHVWAQPFDDRGFDLSAQTRTAETIAAIVQTRVQSR
jgi:DNA-binding winged helix-turn-helix (wHTH) protein/TolB-like protein